MRDEFELENKILHLEYKLAAANEKIARVEAVLLERDPGQYVAPQNGADYAWGFWKGSYSVIMWVNRVLADPLPQAPPKSTT